MGAVSRELSKNTHDLIEQYKISQRESAKDNEYGNDKFGNSGEKSTSPASGEERNKTFEETPAHLHIEYDDLGKTARIEALERTEKMQMLW